MAHPSDQLHAQGLLGSAVTSILRAQAVDRKNLVVVLALGVASGCVLGFLAAAVLLQCSWAAATFVAAAGTPHGMNSPKLSGMVSDDACSLAGNAPLLRMLKLCWLLRVLKLSW